MRIVSATGREDIATVYIGDLGQERLVEFVESMGADHLGAFRLPRQVPHVRCRR